MKEETIDIGTVGDDLLRAYEQGLEDGTPKWIPVSERLPEVGKRVLFSYRSYMKKQPRIFIGWYNGKQWDSLFATEYDVTHWMPLPEPPESVSNPDEVEEET